MLHSRAICQAMYTLPRTPCMWEGKYTPASRLPQDHRPAKADVLKCRGAVCPTLKHSMDACHGNFQHGGCCKQHAARHTMVPEKRQRWGHHVRCQPAYHAEGKALALFEGAVFSEGRRA